MLGGRHRLTLFRYNGTDAWDCILERKVHIPAHTKNQGSVEQIENLQTVSCLCWKADGSKVAVGTIAGGVELFDVYLKRSIHRNAFEFTYISQSSVSNATVQGTGVDMCAGDCESIGQWISIDFEISQWI